MINYKRDDFDGSLDDIMESINEILNKTGDGYETAEENNNEKKDKEEE